MSSQVLLHVYCCSEESLFLVVISAYTLWKRKFKQWWSTIPTTTSHFNSLNSTEKDHNIYHLYMYGTHACIPDWHKQLLFYYICKYK